MSARIFGIFTSPRKSLCASSSLSIHPTQCQLFLVTDICVFITKDWSEKELSKLVTTCLDTMSAMIDTSSSWEVYLSFFRWSQSLSNGTSLALNLRSWLKLDLASVCPCIARPCRARKRTLSIIFMKHVRFCFMVVSAAFVHMSFMFLLDAITPTWCSHACQNVTIGLLVLLKAGNSIFQFEYPPLMKVNSLFFAVERLPCLFWWAQT